VQDIGGERALAAAVEQRVGGSLCDLAWERRGGGAACLRDEIVGGRLRLPPRQCMTEVNLRSLSDGIQPQ